MSSAYIYKVIVHIKQVTNLGDNRNLLVEEDRPYYFDTALEAADFGDKVTDVYGWKYSLSAVPMYKFDMDNAILCFSDDVESLIRSVPPITVAA